MTSTENCLQDTEKTLKSQQTSAEETKNRIKELTKSVGEVTKAVEQLAKLMSERSIGRLPSNTEINPKEQIHAITAHNSTGVDEPNPIQKNEVDEGKVEATQEKPKPEIKEYQPHIPYLEAMKRDYTEEQFGKINVDNALADLGASINVMPYTLFKRLGLGKPKQTRMSIQLADKTVRIPRGIIEDVLVKIDKFVFPVDLLF
ncbi:gag-asp_proteas domain-containing protein [Gossypium australe]|uniref:Gag-asp_proteas domain-containing protein n=1 Tax=Gossypium australe TaxID=47621 RepID=A0A5B6WIL6_9ROSI|nr:gag-asp_proteas domain-containing protein [Gossypium australe]